MKKKKFKMQFWGFLECAKDIKKAMKKYGLISAEVMRSKKEALELADGCGYEKKYIRKFEVREL